MSTASPIVCPRSDHTAASGPVQSMAVLKSSRARPNKNQRGWGNLPPHLLNLIFSNVLDDLTLDIWRPFPDSSHSVALAVARRNWLSGMRATSSGWYTAVNSHPFWAELITTIRTDLVGIPRGPTFYAARAMTSDVCIPCRLSFPMRPPQSASYSMPTDSLGRIPTCQLHWAQICSHCLRVQPMDVRTEPNLFLRRPVNGDVDERGRPRNNQGLLCRPCREVAFNAMLRCGLETSARGGEIRGFDNAWQHTISFKEYVYLGQGRSDEMALQAIEDWFLMHHTNYYQLLTEIGNVQALLRKFKMHLFEHHTLQPPPYEASQISRILYSMFDEDDQSDFDLARLYRRWCHEIDNNEYTEIEYRLDIERVRLNLSAASLWPWIRNKVVLRTIDLWAVERFNNGYWVMPWDEIAQMRDPNKQIHTPLYEIAFHGSRASEYGKAYVVDRWRNGGGRFRFNVGPHELRAREQRNVDQFLPPERLLGMKDQRFTEVLSLRLEAAFAVIMRSYTRLPLEEYGRIEAHLATLNVENILALLQDLYPWHEAEDPSGRWPLTLFPLPPASDATVMSSISEEEDPEEQSFAQLDNELHSVQIKRDDIDHDNDGDDCSNDSSEPREPRIELVATNDNHPSSYGIMDGWITTSDEPDEFEDAEQHEDRASERSDWDSTADSSSPSPKLGKRKAADDEAQPDVERAPRSRLGSGQASSSGDSANTVLVTPDESPSLLAEERIGVAEVHDAASDTTPVAMMANSATSPSASPALGKRKSPDDDDLIRPPRRAASIPASTRTAASDTTDDDMGEGHVKADKIERRTHPVVEIEEGHPKLGLTVEDGMGIGNAPMDEDTQESETRPSKGSGEPPSSSSNSDRRETGRTPSPDPKQQPDVDQAVDPTAVADATWDGAASEYSDLMYDSQSEASVDSDRLAEVPSVPATSDLLGPTVRNLILSCFYGSRVNLRACYCSICVRSRKDAAEAERRRYAEEDDNVIVATVLRIA
ncbi:hypothetical protein CcaverHIS631_0110300 [Cutaneotrichosporon cavernicola]|nr:hypothetical protein CcaverHIS631_0110300 [Cutaneotrichosporon cavernicola]